MLTLPITGVEVGDADSGGVACLLVLLHLSSSCSSTLISTHICTAAACPADKGSRRPVSTIDTAAAKQHSFLAYMQLH